MRLGHQVPQGLRASGEAARTARPVTAQEAERTLVYCLLDELRQLRETSSATAAAARAALNGVLAVETLVLDATGAATRQYRVQVGSVVVANPGANDLTVSSAPLGGGAATVGSGQYPVSAGTAVSVPIGSHTITLYGTAGDTVGLQVYTGLVQPMSGPC